MLSIGKFLIANKSCYLIGRKIGNFLMRDMIASIPIVSAPKKVPYNTTIIKGILCQWFREC